MFFRPFFRTGAPLRPAHARKFFKTINYYTLSAHIFQPFLHSRTKITANFACAADFSPTFSLFSPLGVPSSGCRRQAIPASRAAQNNRYSCFPLFAFSSDENSAKKPSPWGEGGKALPCRMRGSRISSQSHILAASSPLGRIFSRRSPTARAIYYVGAIYYAAVIPSAASPAEISPSGA